VSNSRVLALGAALFLFTAGSALADDLVFTLVNKSKSDLKEFYASPPGVDNWEEDILGTDVLSSGEKIKITIGDGRSKCRYDMKFVFDDGDELEDSKVDLCKLGTYTLRDK
jgi:hypothetical protein